MGSAFEPQNDLETQLQKAQRGDTPADAFFQYLMDSQVYMPIKDSPELGGIQLSEKANPLVMEDEDGSPTLILFTSPDRARPVTDDMPNYRGGLLVEFRWIIERMGSGIGITLNPGWEVGMDIDPQMTELLTRSQKTAADA